MPRITTFHYFFFFFFSSRRRHTRSLCDWSSDVCSSDLFRDGWIYWSQGSTTNSGVAGHDNGGGANQPDIPCQDIVLSQNRFDSGDHMTSGYSPHGVDNRGKMIKAFTGALHPGECFDHLPAVVNAMRRVSARHMVARVEPVLAQHDVLTRDIRLVRATAVVVAGHAGVGRRPLGPVDPPVAEGDLFGRVIAGR